MHAYVK